MNIIRKSCFRLVYLNCNNSTVLNCHRRRYSMAVEPSTFAVCRQGRVPCTSPGSSVPPSSIVDLRNCFSFINRGRTNNAFRLRCCISPEGINNASTACRINANHEGVGNAGADSWCLDLHKPGATEQISPQQFRELDIMLGLGNRFNLNGGACQTVNGSSLESADERHSSPEKVVVAVDVDEVLGSFVSALNYFIADRYSMNHSVSEYYVYEFFKIWNCPRDEADRLVHEFFKTSYFTKGIHPIPGALQTLQKLARFCTLTIVTSRQNAIKDHTIKWIEKHYPGLFQEIHFGNHFALDGVSRPKSEICRSLGAKVLIDDNPKYAMECAEVGIRVLLFDYENSYPWSKMEAFEHPLVTKVLNWEEVQHQLLSFIKS